MGTWTGLIGDYWKVARHYGRQFTVWSMRNRLGIEAYPFMPDGDFGNTITKGPQEIRVATSTQEVVDVLTEARERGIPVNTCGGHHSMRGQTLSAGGLRLIPQFPADIRLSQDESGDVVSVGASARWEALTVLHEQGLAIPVFTTHRSTTIAGTLSISGVGQRSYLYGRQIDTVRSLELILPSGDVVTCSHKDNTELYRHTLSGFGTTGIIRRITLETIDYRPHLVHILFDYDDTDSYLAHARSLSQRAPAPWDDSLRNVWTNRDHDTYTVHYGFEFASLEQANACSKTLPTFLEPHRAHHYASRLTTFEAQSATRRAGLDALIAGEWGLSKTPTHVPFWNEFVFPTFAGFRTFTEAVEKELQGGALRRYYMGVYCLWLKSRPEQPHFPMSFYSHRTPSDSGYHYGYGLYYHVPRTDTAGLEALHSYYRELQTLAHSLDGRLYNYSWHDWSLDTYRQVYGPDWDSTTAHKAEVDPGYLLNPDVLPFR